MFQKIGLAQPFVIIERFNNNTYEAFIENNDEIKFVRGENIQVVIGKLKDNVSSFYKKKATEMKLGRPSNKNGFRNKSKPIK